MVLIDKVKDIFYFQDIFPHKKESSSHIAGDIQC